MTEEICKTAQEAKDLANRLQQQIDKFTLPAEFLEMHVSADLGARYSRVTLTILDHSEAYFDADELDEHEIDPVDQGNILGEIAQLAGADDVGGYVDSYEKPCGTTSYTVVAQYLVWEFE